MPATYRASVAALMAIALAACTSTTAIEPQSQSRDVRLARLYFLRPAAALSGSYGVPFDITINGQKVGDLSPGSYFFVDRPPGRYTMSVRGLLDAPFVSDVDVVASRSYYFEIGPRPPRTNMEAIAMMTWTAPGQLVSGRGLLAGFGFYALDAGTGPAKIAGLKGAQAP